MSPEAEPGGQQRPYVPETPKRGLGARPPRLAARKSDPFLHVLVTNPRSPQCPGLRQEQKPGLRPPRPSPLWAATPGLAGPWAPSAPAAVGGGVGQVPPASVPRREGTAGTEASSGLAWAGTVASGCPRVPRGRGGPSAGGLGVPRQAEEDRAPSTSQHRPCPPAGRPADPSGPLEPQPGPPPSLIPFPFGCSGSCLPLWGAGCLTSSVFPKLLSSAPWTCIPRFWPCWRGDPGPPPAPTSE